MPIWFIVTMVVAFSWLGYETKWFTVRLPCGALTPAQWEALKELEWEISRYNYSLRRLMEGKEEVGKFLELFAAGDSVASYLSHSEAVRPVCAQLRILKGLQSIDKPLRSPTCPSYAGFVAGGDNATQPLCDPKWRAEHSHKELPEQNFEIYHAGKLIGSFNGYYKRGDVPQAMRPYVLRQGRWKFDITEAERK